MSESHLNVFYQLLSPHQSPSASLPFLELGPRASSEPFLDMVSTRGSAAVGNVVAKTIIAQLFKAFKVERHHIFNATSIAVVFRS